MIGYYFCIALLCTITYGNNVPNTTETYTTTGGPNTTRFFTTTDFTPGPTELTNDPTKLPTAFPSKGPTMSPTVTLADGKKFEVTLSVNIIPIIQGELSSWVSSNTEALEATCEAAIGLEVGQTVTCTLWDWLPITIEIERIERRRLLAEEQGLALEYRIVIDDPVALNNFEAAIDSGAFAEDYQEGLENNFDDVTMDPDSVTTEIEIGTGEEFLGEKEKTFSELITSEYIVLGIVCILAGTVWLIMLRKNPSITYEPPTYFMQDSIGGGTGNTMGGNAVEMQTITAVTSGSDMD